MKRRSLLAVLAATAFAAGPASVATSLETSADYTLTVGQGVFWQGPHIQHARVSDAGQCGSAGECFDYTLEVLPGGERLRVALGVVLEDPQDAHPPSNVIGSPTRSTFLLQLYGPAGDLVAADDTMWDDPIPGALPGTGYSVELVVADPAPGTWTARVVPQRVDDHVFRMRARLERADALPGYVPNPQPVDPNMRIIPPYEVNFGTPFAGEDTAATCAPSEIAEAVNEDQPAPALCLRFSTGAQNSGAGPLRLILNCVAASDPTPATATFTLTQRRLWSDGSWRDEPDGSAGSGVFDPAHGHLHYKNLWSFGLWKPVDAAWTPLAGATTFVQISPTRKVGVHPANMVLVDWEEFYQRRANPLDFETEPFPEECVAFGPREFTVQSGWGDIYEWTLAGNYLDFPITSSGEPVPGYYLLRGTANAQGLIFETTSADNMSYALIEVGPGRSVRLAERGFGTDPWDPAKTIAAVAP